MAVAVLAGTPLAGCGSTNTHGAASTNAASASAVRFSKCMRANGVPDFPDPGPDGYELQQRGIDQQSPAGQSAWNACQKDLPSSGPSPVTPESVRREEIALARCMRANGVPNFPDPDASGNIQFPIDSPLPQSPAFQRAQNGPCKKYLGR